MRIEHPHVFAGGIQRQWRVARSLPKATPSQSKNATCVARSRHARAPANVTNRLSPVPSCSISRDACFMRSECSAATHGGRATEARRRRRKARARLTRRNACRQSWVGEGAPATRSAGSFAPRAPRCRSRRPARQAMSARRPGARCGLSIPVTSVHEASTANQRRAAVGCGIQRQRRSASSGKSGHDTQCGYDTHSTATLPIQLRHSMLTARSRGNALA